MLSPVCFKSSISGNDTICSLSSNYISVVAIVLFGLKMSSEKETFETHGGSKHTAPFLLLSTLMSHCAYAHICYNNEKKDRYICCHQAFKSLPFTLSGKFMCKFCSLGRHKAKCIPWTIPDFHLNRANNCAYAKKAISV